MSTDFQRAREALGVRLRELRTEAALSGRQLAARLGWPHSKISKLETGRQTATEVDVLSWAEHTGRPDLASSLVADLRGLETQYHWRRSTNRGSADSPQATGTLSVRRGARRRPLRSSGRTSRS